MISLLNNVLTHSGLDISKMKFSLILKNVTQLRKTQQFLIRVLFLYLNLHKRLVVVLVVLHSFKCMYPVMSKNTKTNRQI